jgi:hypothetical protein
MNTVDYQGPTTKQSDEVESKKSGSIFKQLFKRGEERGFLTADYINDVLPYDFKSHDHIEALYIILDDMGISVKVDDD